MRKLIIAALLLFSVGVYAQPNVYEANVLKAKQNIYLRNVRVDSVSNDTNLTSESPYNLATQYAIRKFVKNNPLTAIGWGNVTGKVTATGSVSGILSSADWNAFNGKQAALNGTGVVVMNGTSVGYVANLDSTRISALRSEPYYNTKYLRLTSTIDSVMVPAVRSENYYNTKYLRLTSTIDSVMVPAVRSENYYNTKYLRLTTNYLDSIRLENTGILHTTPATFSIVGKTGVITQALASQTANRFFAAPNGSNGTPTFRSIVGADVPTLNQNTTGSAGSVANALTISGELISGGATSYNGSVARVLGIQNGAVTNSMLAGSIASNKLVGTDITTVGTIGTGVWNATPISLTGNISGVLPLANGGTGSATQNFVGTTGNQSSLAGNKDWTGFHTFSTNSTSSGLRLISTIPANSGDFTIYPNATSAGASGDFTISTSSGARLFINNYQTLINSTAGLSVTNVITCLGAVLNNTTTSLTAPTINLGTGVNTSTKIGLQGGGDGGKISIISEAIGSYNRANFRLCLRNDLNSTAATTADTKFIVYAATGNVTIGDNVSDNATDKLQVAGNLNLTTAGNKIKIATGTNASAGTSTLASGTVTVSTTAVTASSIILLTVQETGTNNGRIRVSARVSSTSFTILSSDAGDNCVLGWQIIN